MKHGYAASIPYGNENFEVTGGEFCEWEDACVLAQDNVAEENKAAAFEWATYDFLAGLGNFIKQPKMDRPPKTYDLLVSERTQKMRPLDLPDTLERDSQLREPRWTQSRILSEREKLLDAKEKFFLKQVASYKHKQNLNGYHNADGTPWKWWDYTYVVAVLFGIIIILIIALSVSSRH